MISSYARVFIKEEDEEISTFLGNCLNHVSLFGKAVCVADDIYFPISDKMSLKDIVESYTRAYKKEMGL